MQLMPQPGGLARAEKAAEDGEPHPAVARGAHVIRLVAAAGNRGSRGSTGRPAIRSAASQTSARSRAIVSWPARADLDARHQCAVMGGQAVGAAPCSGRRRGGSGGADVQAPGRAGLGPVAGPHRIAQTRAHGSVPDLGPTEAASAAWPFLSLEIGRPAPDLKPRPAVCRRRRDSACGNRPRSPRRSSTSSRCGC